MSHPEDDLRALEEQLRLGAKPYIEKPDEVDLDVGGQCFIDRNRVCGPDCMSFTSVHAPLASERCVILNSMQASMELLGELVQVLKPRRQPTVAPPDIQPPNPMGRGAMR
jgi:hypothetical protein